MELATTTAIDFGSLTLLWPLFYGFVAMLLMATFFPPGFLSWLYNLVGIGVSAWLMCRACCTLDTRDFRFAFDNMVVTDSLAAFSGFFVGVVGLISFLKAPRYLERRGQGSGEYYLLTVASLMGMLLTVSTKHFTGLFLGIETMSITLYLMMASDRKGLEGRANALKYLALGGAGSALLLYGIALIYGQTGSLAFPRYLGDGMNMGTLGALFLLAGLFFKIGAFPFQMWVPDVYGASPTPLAGFMATGVKLAAMIVLARLITPFLQVDAIVTILPWVALITMTVGNILALGNRRPKEVLAYSSVAHTGYLLIGFCSGFVGAREGILFYLAAYTLMTLGAFAVLSALPDDNPRKLQGLIHNRPLMGIGFALCILSLAGIPPLVGFHGKLLIFMAAWKDESLRWLVIGGVINSLIALGYYLPLIRLTLFSDRGWKSDQTSRSLRLHLACFITGLAVVVLGLYPDGLIEMIQRVTPF